MKKIYEKDQLLLSSIFLFLVIEIFVSFLFLFRNFRTFQTFQGVVISESYFKSYIDSKTLNSLKSVQSIFIDNKKLSYEMVDIQKKVLRKEGIWYHEVLIRCSFAKKYHENDSLTITYQTRKEKIYTIFKSCWKEVL